DPGPAPLRRITRFEYGRTLFDLTGVPPSVADQLPPDEETLGFDDIADAYSVSSLHAARYLDVAELAATTLTADLARPPAAAGWTARTACWPRPIACWRGRARPSCSCTSRRNGGSWRASRRWTRTAACIEPGRTRRPSPSRRRRACSSRMPGRERPT